MGELATSEAGLMSAGSARRLEEHGSPRVATRAVAAMRARVHVCATALRDFAPATPGARGGVGPTGATAAPAGQVGACLTVQGRDLACQHGELWRHVRCKVRGAGERSC